MGRTEPTVVKPPPAFRRDARAKRARATVNKVIPALLVAHPRAQRGIRRSELIVDPPPFATARSEKRDDGPDDVKEAAGGKRNGRRKTGDPAAGEPRGDVRGTQVVQRDAGNVAGPRISLVVADTLTAARSLLGDLGERRKRSQHGGDAGYASSDAKPKVGILNMASPLSPGGGFLNGATSQEEALCMRTTLLPGLRDEFYRLPELGVVYTPDVLVFRSSSSSSSSSLPSSTVPSSDAGAEADKDILPKNDRWFVDVASAAMLRLPETDDGRYACPADRELALRKMRAVLRVFAARGCSRVVLGAWGCGAYGNPVVEIAEAWRRVLGPLDNPAVDADQRVGGGDPGGGSRHSRNRSDATAKGKKKARRGEESWGAVIEHVVFAIKDVGLATAFARAFGEDVLPLPGSGVPEHDSASSTGCGEDEEDPVEVARVAELRAKIQELELRVCHARNPHLKAGLETVLAGLRKQLPATVDDGGSLGSEEGVEEEEEEEEEEEDTDDEEQEDTIEAHFVDNGLHATGPIVIATM
ncbi:hypothetical protein F4861DRAFT_507682 [Xylaria intraflava]|nr:hypothetical protein F4861DRAFT_507682 [Xylaria intraflava]